MIRSSLITSACAAIALACFGPPEAGAIEMQGTNPTPALNDGLISQAFVAHRGVTRVGPHGGVYHRGGTYRGGYGYHGYHGGYGYHGYRGGVYRGGVYRGGYGWARPGGYWWPSGGAIAAGAAIGVLAAGAAVAYAGRPPAPGLCWYYTNPSYRSGFWDAC